MAEAGQRSGWTLGSGLRVGLVWLLVAAGLGIGSERAPWAQSGGGLVAAYSFDAGSGTTAADASGNSNNGTIAGATWAGAGQGRFGNALVFDGVNDRVNVTDSPSLDLTTGMTLEAWVFPTVLSGWRTVIMKEGAGGLVYTLYAHDSVPGPAAYVRTAGVDHSTPNVGALPLNAWTHLAATYDGSVLRLYVGGSLVSSQPVTGSIQTSTNALRIGGNAPWGEWFQGRIDEVRIYNRALSQAEIQTDMTTPVGPPASDSTPPTVTSTTPASNATGVSLAATATATFSEDMAAATITTSTVELVAPGGTLVPATVTYDAANRRATLAPSAALAASTTYTGRVRGGAADPRVKDLAGNALAANLTWSFTTAALDTTPPSVTTTAPPGGTAGVSLSAVVTATFSEAMNATTITASTFLLRDPAGAAVPASVSYTAGAQTATLTPTSALAASTTYTATVTTSVRDTAGNALANNVGWSFTTASGPTGLVLAYGFGEGGGGSTTDASGNGNTGTVAGATWTPTGKSGSALSFDGVNDRVNVTDTASLDLTTGMTLEAWVNPTAVSGYRTVLLKEAPGGLAYALYAGDDASRPNAWISIGGTDLDATGSTALSLNTWTHLAATYDGATLRLYVNGAQAASRAVGGAIVTSASALRVGSNTVFAGGEPFAGRIDEVRVYNRALSLGEIQQNMNTPVGGVMTDTTPPTVASTVPASGATGVAVSSVTASFSEPMNAATIDTTTFELRVGAALVPGTVTYSAGALAATLTPTTALLPSTTYTATVRGGAADPRVKDAAGNALAANQTWSFTTGGPSPCSAPPNPVVAENCLPGNPSSEWDGITGAGDPSIQGFATDISVNRGQIVRFKIESGGTYRIDIYRLGHYGGDGARKIATVPATGSLPATSQPACLINAATGLVDCGNWTESATWTVPAAATSGIYLARLVRTGGGASHVVFVVRDDASTSDILFQTSDTTWQAYNNYGGNSLYAGGPGTNPNRAYKVSYNRPFATRAVDNGQDWLFNAEYPMLRWLEANGYHVSYTTGVDSDRRGNLIPNHRIFLSVGHDEYWSAGQRANVEAARNMGVHLAFFSGNEVFWKTRWESSIDGTLTPHRTLVSYKETHAGAKIDPNAAWTGTWRDPRFSPPADGGRPENALTGTSFMVNAGTTSIEVPQADGKMRFWRNTSVASLGAGQTATLASQTLGYEWDVDAQNASRPPGLIRLSTTTVSNAPQVLQDHGSTYAPGSATHHLTLYRVPNGALVFSAGTIQWSWGLDDNHDRGNDPPDGRMQQATVNLLADMGAQPVTLQAGLVAATASADAAPPASVITAPAQGANLPVGSPFTITGTATDAGGGVVGAVEVSVDDGATWHPAVGRGSWSYTWTTPAGGATVTIKSRAVDDSGHLETPSTGVTVTTGTGTASCPCSVQSGQAPSGPAELDANPVELGVKLRTDVSGYITAVRFYKDAANVGPHIGKLWTAGGTLLASAPFVGETPSGWQQVNFPSPVAVTANTTYVASYHTASGRYSQTQAFFVTASYTPPVRFLADGQDGPNGVYRYGPGGFPDDFFNASHYWVDVVFHVTPPPDPTPPAVTATSPVSGMVGVDPLTNVTATFSEAMTGTTISGSTFQLRVGAGPSGSLVPATVTYAPATDTATLNPTAQLDYLTTYTAIVKGGATGVKDSAGNPLSADHHWSFTTAGQPPDQGPGGPILVVASPSNPFGRYYAEILRAEGFNLFRVADIGAVDFAMLNAHDVVILGEMALTPAQVILFTSWVSGGGNLIAMRPAKQLASLLGLTDAASTLAWPGRRYLLIDTASGPGAGLVGETIQFHGTADLYTLNPAAGTTSLATLYQSAAIPTPAANPAVTLRSVGSGQAAAFTFDLARSIVYTRQGNPAWSGRERDGVPGLRSSDLFFGAAQGDPQPDWIDLDKVAIPQADEQQRLLANLILHMNRDRKPLPRFWYLPRGLSAVVVMSGDDHGIGGTAGRFNDHLAASPAGCSVADWQCVRSTSYIFPNSGLTNAQAASYSAQGFEVASHIHTTCADWTPATLEGFYASQLSAFAASYPSVAAPSTNRTHCIAWSDYASQPQVELAHGIRLDTNYYYYPSTWVADRPGLFTGSGMPMRFAAPDGTMIDVYQATTQMTDESGQSYPFTADTLLDRAIGPLGYYGVFTANMHTDTVPHADSAAIVSSAQARQIPVVSVRQLLTWLDGRNASAFSNVTWSGNALGFTIVPGSGQPGLRAMVPYDSGVGPLATLTSGGNPVAYVLTTIKGVSYAFFSAAAGTYQATYVQDVTPPTVTVRSPATGATNVSIGSDIAATFSEALDSTTITGNTFELRHGSTVVPGAVSYDGSTRTATLSPTTALTYGTTYTVTVKGGASGVKDFAGNPLASDNAWTFATAPPPTCPCRIWSDPAPTPANPDSFDNVAVEVGVKFRPLANGYVKALRFYKSLANTGPHVGNLWTSTGTLLATVTFQNETAQGWQEQALPVSVAVTAGVTYVASYHTSVGRYAFNAGYFATGVDNGPLRGLANGEDGPNGVFRYTATSAFPSQNGSDVNYWVDVVFDTVASPSPCPCTIWTPATVPGTVDSGDAAAYELGVKFRASVGGSITSVRFYKSAANTGTHVVNLWSPAGALLATTTVVSGAGEGWQQVDFASPVAIAPATTYVASYHTDVGRYSFNAAYFTSAVESGPLRALASGEGGGNGVFKAGATGFPDQSFNAGNYWIDVVFQSH